MLSFEEAPIRIEQTTGREEHNAASRAATRMARLYFGVLATAVEESYELVSRLIEHGKLAEQEGRKLLDARMDRRNAAAPPGESRLRPMAFASRHDVQDLEARVARLSQQIDEMLKG